MEISALVFRKISSHSFKNISENTFGFLIGPKESKEISQVFPVSHLELNSCNLHTAFSFLEKYIQKIDLSEEISHGKFLVF